MFSDSLCPWCWKFIFWHLFFSCPLLSIYSYSCEDFANTQLRQIWHFGRSLPFTPRSGAASSLLEVDAAAEPAVHLAAAAAVLLLDWTSPQCSSAAAPASAWSTCHPSDKLRKFRPWADQEDTGKVLRRRAYCRWDAGSSARRAWEAAVKVPWITGSPSFPGSSRHGRTWEAMECILCILVTIASNGMLGLQVETRDWSQ